MSQSKLVIQSDFLIVKINYSKHNKNFNFTSNFRVYFIISNPELRNLLSYSNFVNDLASSFQK